MVLTTVLQLIIKKFAVNNNINPNKILLTIKK
jgi:hypothetical protein